VDNPKWHNIEAKLTGRLSPSVRMTIKGRRQSLDGKFGIVGTDARALYFRNRTGVDLKLDIVADPILTYIVYSFDSQSNDARATKITRQGFTLGASAEASPRLELYAEVSSDDANASSSDPGGLASFFPGGNVFVFGANWNLGENSYANFSFTRFATGNDNPLGLRDGNVTGSFFTASVFHRVTNRYELGLTLAPWVYSDEFVPQMGFKSNLITVSARGRF
jgi:hypothetical protein